MGAAPAWDAAMTTQTHADTAWGQVCTAIHARLLTDFPALALGIGPDGAALNKAPRSCVFERNGAASMLPGLRGSIADRMIPIKVTMWMEDPVEAEQAWLRFVVALNFVAHGRASKPQQEDVKGGEIGAKGCKEIGTFSLRLAVVDEPAPSALPLSVELNPVALANPAGAEIETVTLGP